MSMALVNVALAFVLWMQELRHDFEEERKANDRLIEQSDRDKQTIDSLEAK